MENKKVIVRDAQEIKEIKPRCKACYPCPMGVVGCDADSKPHGHGSSKRCPEFGVPYAYVHPHSNVCSLGTPIDSGVRHDEVAYPATLEDKRKLLSKMMVV